MKYSINKRLISLIIIYALLTGCTSTAPDVYVDDEQQESVVETTTINEADEEIDPSEVVNAYKITDTGQKLSYDNEGNVIEPAMGEDFYGQDAQYTGIEPSFTDNGDGTVTDNVTGLMWQQVPVSETMSWEGAITYCENLVLAGYDDWRMPSAKELFGLSDFEVGWPFLDTDYFEFPMASMSVGPGDGSVLKMQGQFWSSNFYFAGTTHDGADTAFGVNHATGHIKGYPSDVPDNMGKYVRAVREEETALNDFVDNHNGTITDEATGLMWMQDDNGEGIEWDDALSYAENLEYAGYDDWRLPNIKELQSIVDYSGPYPAIDPTYFNTTELEENENYYFWSSTSAYFSLELPGNGYGWYVAFGKAIGDDGEDSHGAGAVRFSPKYVESSFVGEGGDNILNSVRLVRDISK